MRQQKIDGRRTEVPGRGPVAARVDPRDRSDGGASPPEHGRLLLGSEGGRRLMRVSMMADLVALGVNPRAHVRICLDRVPGDEPGRRDPVPLQELEDPLRCHHAELAPRNRRRGEHAAHDPDGDRVKVEAQADQVPRHRRPATRPPSAWLPALPSAVA